MQKIYFNYNKNNKVLVSNGKSLVIKKTSSYYRYNIEKTPLNFILDNDHKSYEAINVGTGAGFTVKEIISCFENVNSVKLKFKVFIIKVFSLSQELLYLDRLKYLIKFNEN